MTVYLATYREVNPERIRQIRWVARNYGAEYLEIISKTDLMRLKVVLNGGNSQSLVQPHRWVPLELNDKAVPLSEFEHPRADVVYVLGCQINTIPDDVLSMMETPVYVETLPGGSPVLPTPVVAGIVMHHRLTAGVRV